MAWSPSPNAAPGIDVDAHARRSRSSSVLPRRDDDEAGVDPRRHGMGPPAVGDGRVDLDRAPAPAVRERLGGRGDGVDVARRATSTARRSGPRCPGRRRPTARSSMAATPSAHRASLASSASLAGTVMTSASISRSAAASSRIPAAAIDVALGAVDDAVRAGPAGLDRGRRADGQRTRRDVDVVEDDGVGGDDRRRCRRRPGAARWPRCRPSRRSSIVHPSRWTMWPITQSSPTTVGCSSVVCRTLPSWMLVRAPMRISPSSPRSTALGHTELSGPMVTEPMMTASGWM